MTAVHVGSLNPEPANAMQASAWLTGEALRRERGGEGRHKGWGREKERGARTISQIIWKDYRGFKQIMLSTEGETAIKRLKRLAFLSCKPYNKCCLMQLSVAAVSNPPKLLISCLIFQATLLEKRNPSFKNVDEESAAGITEQIQMFAYKSLMSETTRNPLQINPTEAPALILAVQSINHVGDTAFPSVREHLAEVVKRRGSERERREAA